MINCGTRRAFTVLDHSGEPLLVHNCCLFEPRPTIVNGRKQPHVIPFITWPHQDPFVLELVEHLGHEDIGAEKSRGEGCSWIAVLEALREWLFVELTTIGFVSRTELAVDNPVDPDSLFWKLDWELTKLPKWMVGIKDRDWRRSIAEHTLTNFRNGSTITGYSATGDVASGGRKAWFLMDEFAKFRFPDDSESLASTQHVTNSRLIVSTPKGSSGAYYTVMHEPGAMIRLVLDWKDNPTRNRGLYQFKNGKPAAVDPVNNPLPKEYDPPDKSTLDLFSLLRRKGFKLEGCLRSRWYDHECNRAGANSNNIAQELDRDYGGSVSRFFDHDFFKEANASQQAPLICGDITYHPDKLEGEFVKTDNGKLRLWLNLDVRGRPPKHEYAIGGDICSGAGGAFTSNSSATIIDKTTLEQVGEIVVNTMKPDDFADYCVALANWLHGAYLIWECNGPGVTFTNKVLASHYGNIYRQTTDWRQSRKRTLDAGWHSNPKRKEMALGDFARAVRHGEFKLRSRELVLECGQYIWLNGEPAHEAERHTTDEAAKGKAHGDRVISAAVAWLGVKDRQAAAVLVQSLDPDNPPYGTLAWREKYHRDRREAEGSEWDDRTCDDLAAGEKLFRPVGESLYS